MKQQVLAFIGGCVVVYTASMLFVWGLMVLTGSTQGVGGATPKQYARMEFFIECRGRLPGKAMPGFLLPKVVVVGRVDDQEECFRRVREKP